MRKSKRGLYLLAGCLIAFFLAAKMTAVASDAIKIEIGEKAGAKGDRITIPISLSGNGVAGMDFTVIYDSKELKFVGAEKGESAQDGNLCDINHIEERASVRYVYASNRAITKGGEVLVLHFDVVGNEGQKHTVGVNVKKILDVDIQELPYQVEGGKTISPPTNIAGSEEGAQTSGETRDKGGNGSETANSGGEAEVEAGEASGLEAGGDNAGGHAQKPNEKRIVIKTKDGLKNVTDSIGKKTDENLLKEKSDEKSESRRGLMIGVACVAVIAILVAVTYWRLKRKKR